VNPNYGWSRRPVVRLVVIVLFFFALASHASAEWKERVLYSFQGGTDGATPAGGVVFDKLGNLYGATTDGGSAACNSIYQCGTVYQLMPPAAKGKSWTEAILYVFKGNTSADGASPGGGLIADSAGNLYGTTQYGGTGDCVLLGNKLGCGIVYEVSPPQTKGGAWIETILYSFQGGKDGYVPMGNLTFDKAGNLYGATYYGGGYGSCNSPYYQNCGTIFQLSPPQTKGGKWKEKVLYSFKGVTAGEQFGDGANPNGGLVFGGEGAIYGTTYFGGNNQKGVCEGGSGGTGCGIVFELSPPKKDGGAWTKKLIHQFDAKDGIGPAAGVVFDGSGNLYGTTFFGPPNGFGLIFELKKTSGKSSSWTETVLSLFNDESNGGSPISGLVFDASGDLYGTASAGDEFRGGNVFELDSSGQTEGGWALKVLYGFTGHPDAAHPAASLVFRAGNLYSTTQWGGTNQSCQGGCGTVFEVSP
jgi:hypothetical protein